MTGSIKESEVSAVLELHVIRTYMLRYTTRLTGDDVGVAYMVKQRGLTVIHVSHNGNDGAACLKVIIAELLLVGVDILHHLC